jgi:hypothetical protein
LKIIPELKSESLVQVRKPVANRYPGRVFTSGRTREGLFLQEAEWFRASFITLVSVVGREFSFLGHNIVFRGAYVQTS